MLALPGYHDNGKPFSAFVYEIAQQRVGVPDVDVPAGLPGAMQAAQAETGDLTCTGNFQFDFPRR